MIIPINEVYRLNSDPLNWIVQQSSKQNRDTWRNIAYYPTVVMAMNQLGQRLIREAQTDTLCEALEFVENTCNQLTQALTVNVKEKDDEIKGNRIEEHKISRSLLASSG